MNPLVKVVYDVKISVCELTGVVPGVIPLLFVKTELSRCQLAF